MPGNNIFCMIKDKISMVVYAIKKCIDYIDDKAMHLYVTGTLASTPIIITDDQALYEQLFREQFLSKYGVDIKERFRCLFPSKGILRGHELLLKILNDEKMNSDGQSQLEHPSLLDEIAEVKYPYFVDVHVTKVGENRKLLKLSNDKDEITNNFAIRHNNAIFDIALYCLRNENWKFSDGYAVYGDVDEQDAIAVFANPVMNRPAITDGVTDYWQVKIGSKKDFLAASLEEKDQITSDKTHSRFKLEALE